MYDANAYEYSDVAAALSASWKQAFGRAVESASENTEGAELAGQHSKHISNVINYDAELLPPLYMRFFRFRVAGGEPLHQPSPFIVFDLTFTTGVIANDSEDTAAAAAESAEAENMGVIGEHKAPARVQREQHMPPAALKSGGAKS